MNYILFDDAARPHFLPFTHTRPIAEIRCGILTMRERWEIFLQQTTGSLTENYLQGIFPLKGGADNIYINGAVFANQALTKAINKLEPGRALVKGKMVIAARHAANNLGFTEFHDLTWELPSRNYDGEISLLKHVWDIFSLNDKIIREDYQLITKGRESAPVPEGVTVQGKENLFIEQGAKIYAGCIINATTGPVYVGKDAEIMEGALLRGPISVGEHSVIKMGAKIYGATTIGPACKVGGEINNTVFFANSNKAHDGYLGNAVIGEWCNLGADTNCSNLKNNYDEVKIWSEHYNKLTTTGLTFCGLFMGDHSKCGINTMFNTGTVVGVSCNIFGGGFPNKFIPSFSWGESGQTVTYEFKKAMETATRMMARRERKLTDHEVKMYKHVFEQTKR